MPARSRGLEPERADFTYKGFPVASVYDPFEGSDDNNDSNSSSDQQEWSLFSLSSIKRLVFGEKPEEIETPNPTTINNNLPEELTNDMLLEKIMNFITNLKNVNEIPTSYDYTPNHGFHFKLFNEQDSSTRRTVPMAIIKKNFDGKELYRFKLLYPNEKPSDFTTPLNDRLFEILKNAASFLKPIEDQVTIFKQILTDRLNEINTDISYDVVNKDWSDAWKIGKYKFEVKHENNNIIFLTKPNIHLKESVPLLSVDDSAFKSLDLYGMFQLLNTQLKQDPRPNYESDKNLYTKKLDVVIKHSTSAEFSFENQKFIEISQYDYQITEFKKMLSAKIKIIEDNRTDLRDRILKNKDAKFKDYYFSVDKNDKAKYHVRTNLIIVPNYSITDVILENKTIIVKQPIVSEKGGARRRHMKSRRVRRNRRKLTRRNRASRRR